MAAFAFPPPPGAPGKACIAHGVQGLRGANSHPHREPHTPKAKEAKALFYRHIEDDVERIIPTQAKAQAHEKVEIHPRWRQTPDLREWPSHWPVAEARTPGVVQLAGVVDLSFVDRKSVV